MNSEEVKQRLDRIEQNLHTVVSNQTSILSSQMVAERKLANFKKYVPKALYILLGLNAFLLAYFVYVMTILLNE